MSVAKSDRESIGRVCRLGALAQSKLHFDHLLHLLLRCASVARDAGLHFARRVAVRRYIRLGRGKEDNAANFCQAQRCAHVQRRKHGFYRNGVRSEFFDKLGNHFMDFAKPRRESGA